MINEELIVRFKIIFTYLSSPNINNEQMKMMQTMLSAVQASACLIRRSHLQGNHHNH